MCVQHLTNEKALEETTLEAYKIVNDELEHFFQNRYTAANTSQHG